jgi:hypothetical protein
MLKLTNDEHAALQQNLTKLSLPPQNLDPNHPQFPYLQCEPLIHAAQLGPTQKHILHFTQQSF